MKERNVERKINIVLICMLVVACVLGGMLIVVSKENRELDVIRESGDKIKNTYGTTETANSWEVSENGDGSVKEVLTNDGTLIISGTGNMKDWNYNANWAQKRDNIKTVIISDGITSIGDLAFSNCTGLTKIEIPSSVTSIGDCAFYGCTGLTRIEIPSSVTWIVNSAFWKCTSLTSIKVDENNTKYKDVDGILYTKDGNEVIRCPEGKIGEYSILD